MTKKDILVGAHMSIAGGVSNSIMRGSDIGATTIQIFSANQRQWAGKKITDEEAKKFLDLKKQLNMTKIMSHDNYLINLGSNKEELLDKSKKAFQEEILRCHLLEIDYLNLHPGSATGSLEEDCLDTIIESLLSFSSLIKKGNTRLLLETTAGQGTNVGYKFEHLSYIIKKVHNDIPIGVCIDTCHIFAAGYDIRTDRDWEKTLDKFSKIIGIKYLHAFHINDSKCDLGSRKDRHANLGKGKIGLECFKFLMKDPRVKYLPKYLETPDEKLWEKEIEFLKKIAG